MAYNLFDQAEPELVDWLHTNARTVTMGSDTYIVHEGADNDGIYIVVQGKLLISTTATDGSSVLLAEQGTGSMIGEMSWLEGRPTVASVIASTGTQLLHLSPATLQRLQSDEITAGSLLLRAIGSKLSLQIQSQNAWIHRFTASPHEPLRKVLVLFAELDEQDVDWLRQLGKLQRLPAGGVLLEQGQPVTALSLVLSGEARIQVHSHGKPQVVGSSRRGELLGEMSLFNRDRQGASARVDTVDGLELLSIDIKVLLAALARDAARSSRFWRALARMLSQRSRDQLLERGLAVTSRQAEANANDEEIEVAQLSNISTAGVRFDWLCRQLQSQEN